VTAYRRMRRLRRPGLSKLGAAILGAAAMACVSAIAWAAIPDTAGMVYLCFNARQAQVAGGTALSIVDSTGRCAPGQTRLAINQKGPPGPAGATGPAGPAGAPGAAGAGTGGGLAGYQTITGGGNCDALTGTANGLTYSKGNKCSFLVQCPAGKRVLTGGYFIPDKDVYVGSNLYYAPTVWVTPSAPTTSAGNVGAGPYTAWKVDAFNGTTATIQVSVQAACVSA
jgi:hypothetical protein